MEKSYIINIRRKYLPFRFPRETEERVQKWIIRDEHTEEKEKASINYWNELPIETNTDTYAALQRVNSRIGYTAQPVKSISFYRKFIPYAAIFIFCMFLAGGYLYYNRNAIQMIEVSVAYGESKQIVLPDSSQVWLNAGTRLKYPGTFKGNNRNVILDGEAYFSVTRKESNPFIVQAGDVMVKVLGTQFNVKAYSTDSRIITTLSSGKVEITTPQNSPCLLQPNEQLIYDTRTASLTLSETLLGQGDSWVNGQLVFSNNSVNEILNTLERRFNVSFKDTTLQQIPGLYTIKFLKNENLDEILNILKDMLNVNIKYNAYE